MQKKIITAVLGLALIAGAMTINLNEANAHSTRLGAWIERLFEGEPVFCDSAQDQYCRMDGQTWEDFDRP